MIKQYDVVIEQPFLSILSKDKTEHRTIEFTTITDNDDSLFAILRDYFPFSEELFESIEVTPKTYNHTDYELYFNMSIDDLDDHNIKRGIDSYVYIEVKESRPPESVIMNYLGWPRLFGKKRKMKEHLIKSYTNLYRS